ncbi:4-(cytidine 5'-diphospho)-2-C-methyl-D-erythritol kinase [Geothermobacter hydrogeniphilus]|uniref:4-(cytidine 5'-diphospho)-2-C-methyl-D-erythritol kinase n=1 Tax=Geothermobacter hydrogeniphilus TaxID=1969733 RepID=UPI0018EDAA28|nr:4-(cytidine 5'-diphospho)-2-C-methyl-D-erythritol kinase [Geothermobacter hydrogeniphilus]
MEQTTFRAAAKINLCLHVLGRRSDGYHELAMLMQQVGLYDRVTITLRDRPGIEIVCPGLQLAAGEENIAARAARMVLEKAGARCGAVIAIEKQIPVAAGLGGGSSDAATVLRGLNQMLKAGLSVQEMMSMGIRLGADVPFFLLDSAAWATGIGECLRPVADLPRVWYLLVNPNIPVSTAWVFRNLGLTSPGQTAKLREFPRDSGDLVRLFHNDLEAVTCRRFPVVAEMKQKLLSAGALGALMSGSGATVFGLFDSESAAREAERFISSATGWSTFVVRSLP